jgi:CheY-like chemotaxis protein
LLASDGYIVDTASSGSEAQEKLSRGDYDACILDIRMPGMSGIELFRYLRQVYPDISNRVLFITGDTASSNIGQFLNSNPGNYLTKPFTPVELKDAVRDVIGRYPGGGCQPR